MFAHQVIETLLNNKHLSSLNPDKRIIFAESISLAPKFHFGEEEGLINAIPHAEEYPFFYGSWRKNINPPYPLVWFDCVSKDKVVSKLGFLICFFKNNMLKIYPFVCSRNDSRWYPDLIAYVIDLDEDGRDGYGYEKNDLLDFSKIDIPFNDKDIIRKYAARGMGSITGISNFCLMLLNCKNITTETIQPPEKLNIKRRKNNKQELFEYHVLNVVLPSKKQGYREKTDPNYHVRVHLCRGHFKEYTQEHPLFGSLTGRYWWQPHVRGQNHDGIVMKDYEVKQAIAV